MDKNVNFGTLLMGRTDLFKVLNREVSLIARVPLAQAGAIAVAPVEDSREGARLKDKRAAPSDIAAPTTAQAASRSAGPLDPGDRFMGKDSGSRLNRSDRPESGGKIGGAGGSLVSAVAADFDIAGAEERVARLVEKRLLENTGTHSGKSFSVPVYW